MREIVFRVQPGLRGPLLARAEHLPLTIQAASLEELQHEARDALIRQFGPAHATYRVRIRRGANPEEARQISGRSSPHYGGWRHWTECLPPCRS